MSFDPNKYAQDTQAVRDFVAKFPRSIAVPVALTVIAVTCIITAGVVMMHLISVTSAHPSLAADWSLMHVVGVALALMLSAATVAGFILLLGRR